MRPAVAILVSLLLLAFASPALAHTETDLVAAPAGSEATVTFRPTHGCGGSPTVTVRIRVPLEGVAAGEVDGWTATTEADGSDNTVVSWEGGSLASDEAGAFPVSFVVPDLPGELLLFPAIQLCANGEELAWISGDPGADNPAPRLLVLPEGFEPASSIDEVPADAPGRDLLQEVVDLDNPASTSSTVASTSTTTVTTTAGDGGTTSEEAAPTTPTEPAREAGLPLWPVAVLAAVGVAALGIALRRRAES